MYGYENMIQSMLPKFLDSGSKKKSYTYSCGSRIHFTLVKENIGYRIKCHVNTQGKDFPSKIVIDNINFKGYSFNRVGFFHNRNRRAVMVDIVTKDCI